jgi:basic amino acid/polyamine antiporter, APA family
MSTHNKSSPGLVRGLGVSAASAIVMGTMIGTGIFLKPSEMAQEAGSISVVFLAWIVAGVLSMFGALCYAELGATFPEAGGEYAYLRRGFGKPYGFLFGWMHSVVARPASAAAIAAGLLRFCSFLFPTLSAPLLVIHVSGLFGSATYNFAFTKSQPLAVVALVAITAVNYLGVRVGGRLQVVLTILKVGAVLAIIAGGFFLVHHRNVQLSPLWPASPGWGTFTGFLAAMGAAVWAYDGWNDLNLVGSEVENPERNFPRVLVGTTSFVIVVFLLFSAVCFYTLPFSAIASSQHVASDVFGSFAGHNAALWITIIMAISALGTLNSSILSGARVDYAMARDGIFFSSIAKVHPAFRTPVNALILQCCIASLLALTGTFEDLTSLVMFGSWTFYGVAVLAMMRMRRTEPNIKRPYLTWGYPVVPVIFMAGAWSVALGLWMARPIRSTIGVIVVFAGLFFYRAWSSKLERKEQLNGEEELEEETLPET